MGMEWRDRIVLLWGHVPPMYRKSVFAFTLLHTMFFDLDNEEEDNIAKSVIQPHMQCFPYPKQAGQIEQ